MTVGSGQVQPKKIDQHTYSIDVLLCAFFARYYFHSKYLFIQFRSSHNTNIIMRKRSYEKRKNIRIDKSFGYLKETCIQNCESSNTILSWKQNQNEQSYICPYEIFVYFSFWLTRSMYIDDFKNQLKSTEHCFCSAQTWIIW